MTEIFMMHLNGREVARIDILCCLRYPRLAETLLTMSREKHRFASSASQRRISDVAGQHNGGMPHDNLCGPRPSVQVFRI